MMRTRLAPSLALALVLGCSGSVAPEETSSSGGDACEAGEQAVCRCPDGSEKLHVCAEDRQAFEPCPCGEPSTTSTSVTTGGGASGPTSSTSTSSGGDGGGGGAGGAGDGGAGDGGASQGGGGAGGTGGGPVTCEIGCGSTELCGDHHAGVDDDCDGDVDEGCDCAPGETLDCFEGDPTYRDSEGCFPGVMRCTELGAWGACEGGVHPTSDPPCFAPVDDGCQAITTIPFRPVDLGIGIGNFGDDAESESWTVACPPEVAPCPGVDGIGPVDDFQPLQAGEYTVTYEKTVGGQTSSCTYPLFVEARGLRVELSWRYEAGTDLDLHLLEPGIPGPIERNGTPIDCAYNNCTLTDFEVDGGVEWFPLEAPPGEPTAWTLDPDEDENSCYFAPRGYGAQWRNLARGCHNPRLDLDNITCDLAVTDVNDPSFCAPENINVDVAPENAWMRIGVVHFSGNINEPTLRIFCGGSLHAVLGPEGFQQPVELTSGVWVAADVALVEGPCSTECVVRPVYFDPVARTPFIEQAPASGPAFPPLP